MKPKQTKSTVFFVSWLEEGDDQARSGFGHSDRETVESTVRDMIAKQAHRNPNLAKTVWIGIRSETVINDYFDISTK